MVPHVLLYNQPYTCITNNILLSCTFFYRHFEVIVVVLDSDKSTINRDSGYYSKLLRSDYNFSGN